MLERFKNVIVKMTNNLKEFKEISVELLSKFTNSPNVVFWVVVCLFLYMLIK